MHHTNVKRGLFIKVFAEKRKIDRRNQYGVEVKKHKWKIRKKEVVQDFKKIIRGKNRTLHVAFRDKRECNFMINRIKLNDEIKKI